MDQETSDLLTRWGLNAYVNAFSDARIDMLTLPYITEFELASLINTMGDGIRFRSSLEAWKQTAASNLDRASPTLQEVPVGELSKILHDLDQSHSGTEENQGNISTNNSVLEILNTTIEGKAILKKGAEFNGPIGSELRKQLCKIIIRKLIGENLETGIPSSQFKKLAADIHKLFPAESPAVYYSPYLPQTKFQAKRNASGLLFNVYTSQKRNLRKLGVLPTTSRSHSRASTTQSNENIIPASGIIIADLQEENNIVDICLLLIPNIINIPPMKKKGAWKPSRSEFRDGFVINAPSEAEVRPILQERRNKLANLKVSFQPLVVFSGEPTNITHAYVVVEETLYPLRTLNRAVDVTFKVMQATGAEYSQESYDIWLLLQVGFYNLKTTYDRQSASLKQILLDLGLKDNIQ